MTRNFKNQREFSRTDRLRELMHRELAELLQRETKDPRLGMVTISEVEVTRDLAYAKVFVTILGDAEEVKRNLKMLNHAAGFFRTQLAKRIKVRKMPELMFHYDASNQRAAKLSHLIDSAIKQDKKISDTDPDE